MSSIPPDPTPIDEYEQDRLIRAGKAQTWIARLNRWWLAFQVATVGMLCAGGLLVVGGKALLIVIAIVWGLSIVAAAGSAGVTLKNWSVLSRLWIVIGFAPWAILLMEVTAIALGLVG